VLVLECYGAGEIAIAERFDVPGDVFARRGVDERE
jgi:hypothetical protein